MSNFKIIREELEDYADNTATKFLTATKKKDGENFTEEEIHDLYIHLQNTYRTDEIMIQGLAFKMLTIKTYDGDYKFDVFSKYEGMPLIDFDKEKFKSFSKVIVGLKIKNAKLYKKDKNKYFESIKNTNI